MKKNNTYNLQPATYNLKSAFSFVEVIIVISVIVLLAVVALNANTSYKEKANTVKVESDSKTLKESFTQYYQEMGTLPMPGGNNNYFKDDGSYGHTGSPTNFGVHGYVTADTLPNKYINYLPLDPKTNQFYAYGKTLTGATQFEIASVIWKNALPETKLEGNYPGETGPISLIREYNGPNFVMDKSKTSFPYNPEELLLTAKINSYSGSVTINGNDFNIENTTLVSGDEIVVPAGGYAELYFSDGSSSVLGDSSTNSTLVLADMAYKAENNLVTKIKLALNAGTLWTNATSLNDESEFNVFTADASAAVRGTVFGVSKVDENTTNISVEVGKVAVAKVSLYGEGVKLEEAIKLNAIDTLPIYDTTGTTVTDGGETYINVDEGIDSPKGINITSANLPIGGTIEKINYNLSSLENVALKLKSISRNTDDAYTTLTFKNKRAYSGAMLFVGNNANGSICNSADNDFVCTTTPTPTVSGSQKVKLCKDISLGAETLQTCTHSIEVNLGLNAEQTPEDSDRETKENLVNDDDFKCSDNFERFNGGCVENSLGDDWDLVAYAPYNENITLYDSTGEEYAVSDSGALDTDNCGAGTTGSFCTISGSNKGIFIDNDDGDGDDFIKYENLNLSGDFAIEMSVQKNALEQKSTKYLLDILGLAYPGGNSYIIFNGTNLGPYNLSFYNTFEKIIIKNGDRLIIGGEDFNISSHSISINELFIGSKKDKAGQINGIIDYVKIYKK
ncbi:MAG: FecR family protein [Candidatus Gracilibacteria bacterium]|nr:FecR family protein [Candidatus Gracilibacteria bacterium]